MKRTLILFIAVLAASLIAAPAHAQTTNPPQPATFSFGDALVQGTLTIENPSGQTIFTENDLGAPEGLPLDMVNQIEADPAMNLSPYAAENLPSLIGPEDTDFGYVWDAQTGPGSLDFLPGWLPNLPPSQLLSANGSIITGTFDYGSGVTAQQAVLADLLANAPFSDPIVSDTVTNKVGIDGFNLDETTEGQPWVATIAESYDTVNIVEQETSIVPEASSLVLLIAGIVGLGLFAWTRRRKAVTL